MPGWLKFIITILIVIFTLGLFYWALFATKQDVSEKIYQTLQAQAKRADFSFKKVTFEEVSAGEKFWQLTADNAVVNKDAGNATLQNTDGTFYKKGRPVLRFRSPAALWEMKKQEIYLDKPLGYDAAFERQILALFKTIELQPLSLFTLPGQYKKGLGYWFQARNLSWDVADQQLLCTGGILLSKGEITARAAALKGDVEFNNVALTGAPSLTIAAADHSLVTLEAQSFELQSAQDLFIAQGSPVITWKEARVLAAAARYFQRAKKIELAGNVTINYKDINAAGAAANFYVDRQQIVLTGNARATQGGNNLTSDKVIVSLKDQKIALAGRSKVVISGDEVKP